MHIEDTIPQEVRLREGIFFTRHNIVEEIHKCFDYSHIETVVDSAAGSCNFLISLAEMYPEKQFYGVEKNKIIYDEVHSLVKDIPNVTYFHGDILIDSFPIPKCDLYVGNPPFVNYADLESGYQEQVRTLWTRFFDTARGFKMLLGHSRGDISQLIFYYTIEHYLKPGGRIGVILPDSLIQSNRASAAFREFTNIGVEKLVDISHKRSFDNTRRNCFYLLGTKGEKTTYPLAFEKQDKTAYLYKIGSDLIEEDSELFKRSDYTPRQGINTLGANGIFFFKDKPEFSSPLIKPLLKSSDVQAWRHDVSYSVLVPYEKGQIIPEERLADTYPRAYEYLLSHKDTLENRRSRFAKRYWYALFGVGEYTFAKYKVVWRSLGAHDMAACVVDDALPNQALHCYIATDDKKEAYYVCGILNSDIYSDHVKKVCKAGSKSFAQPSVVKKIYIPRFNEENVRHADIARVSISLHKKITPRKIKQVNKLVQGVYFGADDSEEC